MSLSDGDTLRIVHMQDDQQIWEVCGRQRSRSFQVPKPSEAASHIFTQHVTEWLKTLITRSGSHAAKSPATAGVPEMVDRAVHAEERQDKGTGPAVTLPDEVAARVPRLAQPLLCDGSV